MPVSTCGVTRRLTNVARTALAGGASIVIFAQLTAAEAPAQVLRGSDGTVACLVTAAPDDPNGQRQLAVHVRAPGGPAAEVIALLPPELRDFSALPIRILLIAQPIATSAQQRLPVSVDPTLEHPAIDGTPSAEAFVRAIFPHDWVVAGATILGERMVVAPDGTKVTSQTRCAITASDAAQWR